MKRGPGTGRFADLTAARLELCSRLVRASRDRRSPWHTPVVATIGLDGSPRARVMVLRAADPDARRLRLHTDVRAAKVAEIARDCRVALVFYDAPAGLQLRIEGLGRIEAEGGAADAAWAATRPFSRRCYTAPRPPGAPADGPESGLPLELEEREPTLAESEAGRPNFSILQVEATKLEFLQLSVRGHRRGYFTWQGGQLEEGWLVP